ncbi:hypothetical protein [Bacillus sp. SG-1]|uniref:hypothetical protein n=1 Tax=Bacillus sp. SG-1 TaxID=161544 RepID=UPI0001543F32|nr:hypothetical protein [Bacillus sp. SG-1]EDL66415.1 hypothetical protein BSG1_03645 [Bacillus sp. SG-1]
MEFLFVIGFHVFIMGAVVILFSGAASFLLDKTIHLVVVVGISMLAGLLYAFIMEIPSGAWFFIVMNAFLSTFAILIIQAGKYAKRKAEEADVHNG